MRSSKTVLGLLLATGLLLAGCGDSTSSGTTGAPSASGTGTAKVAALADSDLPVAADFEEEAEKAISNTNYKSELDALEKEVDAP